MILSLTHNILGIYKFKVGYKNCIERNKILQFREIITCGYILSNLIKEDLRKTRFQELGF